jgi:transposase
MKFYTNSHRYYCGIDLHARCLYVCILDASSGDPCLHKQIPATPKALMKLVAPYREDLVVGVECMFTWYWVADFCEEHSIPFILGHALYMRAIHGGKAKNDKIDSLKIALLMRSGMFPLAYTYPRPLRGTRDLMRRRIHMMRKRAELLAHVHNTTSQYNLPPIGVNLRYAFNREGVAETFSDPSVQKSIAFDLALIDFYDKQLSKIEWHIKQKANAFDQHALMLLRSVPGIGLILSLTILCEIHDIDRFDRVQNFASYARLVKCKR